MNGTTLLALARGPMLDIALAILVLGTLWRLAHLLWRPWQRDFSEPRRDAVVRGAVAAIVSGMWQRRTFRERTLPATLSGYAYHIGLAIVFFGFVPHIAFVERLTGISWPAVPGWLFVTAVGLVFLGMGYALLMRLTSPVLRLLSSFDDYASWVITMLPVLTGMAVLTLALDSPYPTQPLAPMPVAIHLLSVELLLVWLPFGKLSHAFLVFVSRGATGAAFARRGARP